MGLAAGEEVVEDGAEAVDIGGSGDFLATDLFRAGEAGREDQRLGAPVEAGIQHAGDAEVEEFRFAVAGNQNVGRLEIAVDDELAVGVIDGIAEGEEDAKASGEGQGVLVAVLVQPESFDKLHDKVRQAVLAGAAVEQARDVGVDQRGEDLAFHAEAFEGAGVKPTAFDNFDGDGLVDLAVHAFGAEDGTHAATAEQRAELIGAEAFTVWHNGALAGDGLLEETLRAGVISQQGDDGGTNFRRDGGTFQEGGAAFRRQIQRADK